MVIILVLVILLIGIFFKVICPQNDEIIMEDTGEVEPEPLTPSSSSPRTAEGSLFDVFLSFHGKDTRKGFTGHLHEGLHTRGISTFIDSENLDKGEEIEGLLGYIEKSKICIPIFSKGYADSRWCLRELAQIVKCKKEVVPVFFDVDPSDVKKQSGPFASAFKKHESNRKLKEKEVRKWRKALTKVGNISGFSLKDTDGDEVKLKHAIIERVSSKVNKLPLEVATHPVGTKTRLADVKEILGSGGSDHVRMVGIHGMGGLGKTTIAKTVYNDLHKGFSGNTCFLSNIGENAKESKGLVDLQKQLIRDIMKEKDISFSDVSQGKSLIKERAKGKRVLLILDDVDSNEQLKALAGGRDWFGSGSVIIITTRDEKVLLAHDMEQHEIYKPRELDEAQSCELFTRHAFKREQPQGEFIKLSKQLVSAAGGLPLTLEVLGSQLYREKDAQIWQDTLERLKKIPPTEVQLRLKLSYDRLLELEKKIFLDISCFFIGRDREYATYMWEGCGWSPKLAIHVLVQRSLVKINESSGEFEMHDQLRDMGRAIVEEESSQDLQKQSRLLVSQDSKDFLQRKVSGTIDAEGIRFSFDEIILDEYFFKRECVSAHCFEEMPNLRYFAAANVNFQGTFNHFPVNLRWLALEYCGFDSLPSDFNLEKIAILRLHETNMAQIFINQWSRRGKAFEKLKVLEISRAEIKITPDFTCIPCLVKLTLEECLMLTTIDESIGKLKSLVYVCIRKCQILEKLPDSICGLSSLEVLDIRYCSTISSLPKRLGDLESLTKLTLKATSIVEIPDSIGQLENLHELHIKHSLNLSRLPDSIGQLKNLHELRIENSPNLSRLPDSICQLSSLQKLGLRSCIKFSSIPERLGDVESLKELDLIKVCIETIPDSIGELSNLCKLSLKDSKILWKLPDSICQLSSLKSLDLDGCFDLCSLPERLGDMENLEELTLDGAMIDAIPDSVGQLVNLRLLSLENCKLLKALPDSIRKLSSLQQLNRAGTSLRGLENIPNLGSLGLENISHFTSFELSVLCNQTCRALKCLRLVDASIEELPNCVGGMENLEELLLKCEMLRALPNWIDRFSEKLTELEIKNKHLNALPDCIGSLKLLRNLSLECENLEALPDSIGRLENIRNLKIEAANLKVLPDSIGGLKQLQHFRMRCSTLETLPDSIGRLENIGCLEIVSANLKVLPDSIGGLKQLWNLMVRCSSLETLPDSIGLLENILWLRIESAKLKVLPDSIGGLKQLHHLEVRCSSLETLPDLIGRLENIQWLEIKSANLKALPDSIGGLKRLEDFRVRCSSLETLPDSIGWLENILKLKVESANLKIIPDSIGGLKQLSEFRVRCSSLETLPDSIGRLENIRCLTIESANLKALPDSIGELESLKNFEVDSDGLKYLPNSIGSLTGITSLSLNCVNLEALPDCMGVLESLQDLELHCDNFTIPLDIIGRLDNLVRCSFKSKNLKHLHATIASLGRLEKFSLSGCENLESLTGFADLSSLQSLELKDCKRLQYLPLLPSSLRWFNASGCTNLQNMSDVSDLKRLKELSLNGCRLLEDVPGLENIASNLQELGLPGPYNFMGSCHLSHDFRNKVFKNKGITFGNLRRFEISGSIVRGSAAGQQKLEFMIPRLPFSWWRGARLTLRLDKDVSPIHLAFTADDITVFEKAVEVMEGDKVAFDLREEGISTSWQGVAEKKHCCAIHVTADVSQLQNFSALLQQTDYSYGMWW